jgi:hypothetical protein
MAAMKMNQRFWFGGDVEEVQEESYEERPYEQGRADIESEMQLLPKEAGEAAMTRKCHRDRPKRRRST